MTIQGYLLITLADTTKTAFTEVFQKYPYKFNLMVIGGCAGERHSKRRTFWDWIPAESKWYQWECASHYELEEMVRSGRVELINHTMSHIRLENLYDNAVSRDTSLLTQTANSGQKNVVVADGSKFDVGDRVKIYDNSAHEWNKIASINGNTLTMVNNLANTYAVANGGAVLETGLSEQDLMRQILPVDDLVQLVGQSAGCKGFAFPFGSQTEEIVAIVDAWFPHYQYDGYGPSNYSLARNTFPLPKNLKLVSFDDKEIIDHGWTNVDAFLNDARNNHLLHCLGLESIETQHLAGNSRSLSPTNWATLADKISDFHAEGRLVLMSELGTLV